MVDLVADGMPYEPPEEGWGESMGTSGFGEGFKAQVGQTLAEGTEGLSRALYQGQYEHGWWGNVARGLALSGAGQVGLSGEDIGLTDGITTPVAAPKLTAEQANKKYAPLGPDGEPVKITDKEIPEPVAASIGRAKAAELDRAAVLANYGKTFSWPTRFASGAAAFIMDPVNAASLFLPGVGEETVLAGLGRAGLATTGFAARTAARAVSGATAGAVGQAALAPLKYGIGAETEGDYTLRQAFNDLMYGAAGGAVVGAGVGALTDLWRTARVTQAIASIRADAMRAATAQMVDGRPVDVDAVLDPRASPAATVEAEQQQYRNGFSQGITPAEYAEMKEDIYGERGRAERAEPATKAKTQRPAEAGAAPPPVEEGTAPVPAEGAAPARMAGEEEPARTVVIDNGYDVVSGAVGSKDLNGPVYIDRNIPEYSEHLTDGEGNPARLWTYLAAHEMEERRLMAEGMSYDKAHVQATAVERDLVQKDGVDWDAYTHEIDGHLAKIEHEEPNRVPPDPHIDPNMAIGKHTSENKQAALHSLLPRTKLEAYTPIPAEHQKTGMVDNTEALRDHALTRREKGYGAGTIKIFKSAHAEAEAHGESIPEVNSRRAEREEAYAPKLDAALAERDMEPRDLTPAQRAAVFDLMDRGYEDRPDLALDVVFAKLIAEGRELDNLDALAAVEGAIREAEQGYGDLHGEIPFDSGEGIVGEGAPRQGPEAPGPAPAGEGAREAGGVRGEEPAVPTLFAGREAYAPATEHDAALADAESTIDPTSFPPSARAELAEADAALTEAQALQQAYAQAATCLIEGGEA